MADSSQVYNSRKELEKALEEADKKLRKYRNSMDEIRGVFGRVRDSDLTHTAALLEISLIMSEVR